MTWLLEVKDAGTLGFESLNHFETTFRSIMGVTPPANSPAPDAAVGANGESFGFVAIGNQMFLVKWIRKR